ncbi:MAG: hypothetical protein Fur0046_01650 [Cyanobacteria bacterium J069]
MRLYAEVIQLSETRPVGWLRPLLLLERLTDSETHFDCFGSTHSTMQTDQQGLHCMIDLRQGADLLLPVELMRHALDTELIPLWSALHALKPPSEGDRPLPNPLHSFTQRLWNAYPTIFETLDKRDK